MNATLRALYEGEISPAEQYRPQAQEYRRMQEEHYQHYEAFIKKLEKPLAQEFKEIMDEQLDTLPLEFYQMFLDGFRLGAKMIIEVYEEEGQG